MQALTHLHTNKKNEHVNITLQRFPHMSGKVPFIIILIVISYTYVHVLTHQGFLGIVTVSSK